jgi:hypothetical protein
MTRTAILTAVCLALATGGAAMAQQADAVAGASAEAETGLNGVYGSKSMLGLPTAGTEQEEAEAGTRTDGEVSAEAEAEAEVETDTN